MGGLGWGAPEAGLGIMWIAQFAWILSFMTAAGGMGTPRS
jgi:hypothetical protein